MSNFTTSFQLTYLAAAVCSFGFLAVVIRAPGRRILGALASVIVFTALSAPIDDLGGRAGWWFYPSCVDPPHPPLLVYLGQAFCFVGGVALLGWRVQRRWGERGLVALTVVVCGAGLGRDVALAALFPAMIRLGPAPAAQLADVAAWLVVVIVALGVTRLISGPARHG
jgi:hypothetical protein